ncbi:PspA/IM30 family protein [Nocardia xishanensis]|uniref:PspA/IM30 family protein n=1 Tax=Nocardia xishanensis TaxID=238964 RepID=UPI000A97E12F|nr:hypothetical protein [Nocardia xishanensis]
MSDTRDIAARLAALPDAELVTVLRSAVEGRSAFWAVRAALDELAGVVRATHGSDVSPATFDASVHDGGEGAAASGQVGGGFPVPSVPVQPTGIPVTPETGGYSPSGVPTFESVRDKVEQRFGTAQGMGELDRQTPAGRSADERFAAREKAARERLDQIRKSMRGKGAD